MDARSFFRFGILLAAVIAAASAGSALAAVGRTEGAAAVTPLGTATYSVPLDLPSGINGLTPSLSLIYSHRAGNGLLGVGWSVSGLSAISRCNKSWAQDGAPAPVQLV